MKQLILGFAALVALSGAAAAHYNGSDRWHDFGTDLGAFGASPAGEPVGACWFTDSTFLDVDDPGGLQPGELWGHTAGLGVDYDGDCAGQAEAPALYGTFTAPAEGEVGAEVGVGAGTPPLSELPELPVLPVLPEPPALPELPPL